jgi:hypothetical protein
MHPDYDRQRRPAGWRIEANGETLAVAARDRQVFDTIDRDGRTLTDHGLDGLSERGEGRFEGLRDAP